MTFRRPGQTPRRASRTSVDISPTRIEPALSRSGTVQEEQRGRECENENEPIQEQEQEHAPERKAVPTQGENNLSGFILASQLADMRLPPDEYFPSRPLGATTSHRNVHQYFPVHTSPVRSNASTPHLSETSEEADDPVTFGRTSSRSTRFQHEQGIFSNMYSALVRTLASKSGIPVRPILKKRSTDVPSGHLIHEDHVSTRPEAVVAAITTHSENTSAAEIRPKSAVKGKDETVVESTATDKDKNLPEGTSSSEAGPVIGKKPTSKDKGKGKVTFANQPADKDNNSPQWESISEDTPTNEVRPTAKDKGKAKAVSGDIISKSRTQTDGPAPEEDCAIEEEDLAQPQAFTRSSSRTSSLERLQDRSDRATSGEPWGMLRTESPDRKPPRFAHPKTPDRTFPIQPLPPVQPSMRKNDFKVRHYPHDGSTNSNEVPSSSASFTSAISILAKPKLLAGKVEVQRSVKSQLGISKIPSPTLRPMKSMTDGALGFFYSDKNNVDADGKRDLMDENVLD